MTQTETTTMPTGIAQLSEPCWELYDVATDRAVESGEVTPHFTDEAEANSMAESVRDDDDAPPPMVARPLDAPCWTARAACGAPVEHDGGGISHWLAGEDALREALDCDWSVVDGVLRCEDGTGCTA